MGGAGGRHFLPSVRLGQGDPFLLRLSSVPSSTQVPLFQGPGFPPLYNKLRNLQGLLDPRTRGGQVSDVMSFVRTAALMQVTRAGSRSIRVPWSHIYRVRMATG